MRASLPLFCEAMMNYEETLRTIHSLEKFPKTATLSRMRAVLSALGHPERSFRAIHVAGTNGKGSVCAMLANILPLCGLKTGLFISPFVIDFRERIQVNGIFIGEEALCRLAEVVRNTGVDLCEFEFITALAFLYYRECGCDVAVIETGLGGRLDATNVLESPLVTVITKIGLDHTAILGGTLAEIAREKCGIVKGAPVVTSPAQPPEAAAVLQDAAPALVIPETDQLSVLQSGRRNRFLYKGTEYETALPGAHQIENALCVIEAAAHSGLDIPAPAVQKGIAGAFFPARLEWVDGAPPVLLDGAHNPDGAAVLAKYLKENPVRAAIVGVMRDKDVDAVLREVLPLVPRAVAVAVEGMPRSLSAGELREKAAAYCPCETADSYAQALGKAKRLSRGGSIAVFGSLYLASGVRKILKDPG